MVFRFSFTMFTGTKNERVYIVLTKAIMYGIIIRVIDLAKKIY